MGNETDNKCTECKSTHETKNDFEDDNNCYIKCSFNYYYDSDNKYQCTNDNSCPINYNKFIPDKKRCIDECKNDNIYKYEYQINAIEIALLELIMILIYAKKKKKIKKNVF